MADFELSERELKLLTCYAEGKTDDQISAILGVKKGYAGTLGLRMRRRMGAVDRANAVAIAYEARVFRAGVKRRKRDPKPIGRPAVITAEVLAEAHAGISRGESVESIAARVGVGRSTLYRALAGDAQ